MLEEIPSEQKSTEGCRLMMQQSDKLRILIVDDSISIRYVLRAFLDNAGFHVVGELGSGRELLSAIVKLSPHIICLDYNLPDKDGLSLLREIHIEYPHIAVVMVTGASDAGLESVAAEAGTAGFIHKPFSQEQITSVFHRVAYAQRLLMVAARKHNSFENKPYRASAVIADDSQTLRRLLTAILTHMGIEVVGEACDGRQATELVSEKKPDIVCLDLEMPVMSGLEALKIIHSQYPLTKAIMVTAIASRETFDRVTSLGIRGYIIKPYHPDKVTQTISHILTN